MSTSGRSLRTLVPLHAAIGRLEPRVRDYLQAVGKSRGAGLHGSYIPKARGGGWLVALAGAGMLAFSVYLLFPAHDPAELFPVARSSFWQIVLGAGGLVLLAVGLRTWLRRMVSKDYLGDFLWADAAYLWDVGPYRVSVSPLGAAATASATHIHNNLGAYLRSVVELKCPERRVSLTIVNKSRVEDLVMFVNAASRLATQTDGELAILMRDDPALRSMVARKLLDGSLQNGTFDLREAQPIPNPGELRGGLLRAPRLYVLAAAAAGVLLAMVVYPWVASTLADERLFALVLDSSQNNLELPRSYLDHFPAGRHVAEARQLLDDRAWARAEETAKSEHDPSALREYVASKEFTRHRTEAQEMINGFYDEAIARLRKTAGDNPEIDQTLFSGMVAVLESLKRSSRPVVTVGFAPSLVLEPESEEHKLMEKLQIAAYEDEYPDLKSLAERAQSGSPILPTGDVFTDDQVRLRESVILDRLRAAFQNVLSGDIITFEPAGAGAAPNLAVGYHVFTPGDLYVYTRTHYQGGDGISPASTTTEVQGLLRGYRIAWTLTIRPPGSEESYVYNLESQPAESLHYRQEPGDPNWATYAILLYSAFHDFSGKVIRGFALTPPPSPSAFSFADATGSQDTSPVYTAAYPPEYSSPPSLPEVPAWEQTPQVPTWNQPIDANRPADWMLPPVETGSAGESTPAWPVAPQSAWERAAEFMRSAETASPPGVFSTNPLADPALERPVLDPPALNWGDQPDVQLPPELFNPEPAPPGGETSPLDITAPAEPNMESIVPMP